MADTIASQILSLGFEVDERSAKNALARIQGLRSGLNTLASQTKALAVTTSGLTNEYGKFSAKAIQARNELLKGTQAAKEQITVLGRLKSAQGQASGGGDEGGGGGIGVGRTASKVGRGLRVLGFADLGGISTSLGRLSSAASAAGPLIEETGASVLQMGVAGGLAAVAIVAVGIAVEDFTKKMEANKQRITNAIDSQKTYYELLQTGTSESIKTGLEDLRVKLLVAQAVRRDIQAGQDQLKGFGILQGAAEQFTGLTDKVKAADDEINSTQAQIDAFTKALDSNQVAVNDNKAAIEKQTEALKQSTESQQQAITKARADIRAVEVKAAEDEANILQKAADQRVAIAQRAAEQEADALTNLQRSQAEDRIKLGQEQADARVEFQRDETRSAEAHFKTLEQIRKDAEADETELVLHRDFAGLAALRRQTDKRLAEEDDKYVEERRQRLTALRNQLSDQNKAFIREREARIRQYQAQLTDLRTVQNRQIQANDEAARVDLERLHAKLRAELAMKADAYSIELQLLTNLVNRAKVLSGESIHTQFNANQGHESQGPGLGGYASGGYLPPNTWATVNERGQESITSAGRTMWLPTNARRFMSSEGGTINPAGSAGGINVSIGNVNGSSPREVARIAGKITEQHIIAAFEELAS